MNKSRSARIVSALLVLAPLLVAVMGCGIIATPQLLSTATPATAEVEPTATLSDLEGLGDSPMTITQCDIDASGSQVEVTVSYETTRDIEENDFFIYAEVLSEGGDPILTLNVDSDKRVILINASGQVLLSAVPYEIETEDNTGTIRFHFAKKDYGYDIRGVNGGMRVFISERVDPESEEDDPEYIPLADITNDGISY